MRRRTVVDKSQIARRLAAGAWSRDQCGLVAWDKLRRV